MLLPFTLLSRSGRGNSSPRRGAESGMVFLPRFATLFALLFWQLLVTPATVAEAVASEMVSAETANQAAQVTPEWVERYLYTRNSALLDDSPNDHVMSFYYFGRLDQRTLIGLERVRGDDYEQFFSLLVFEGAELLGYYRNVLSFPSGVADDGEVQFPRGVDVHLQGSDALLNITAPVFSGLCQRQRGAEAETDLCVPWMSVRSQ